MLNALIVGASGYTGAELVRYINKHSKINILALTVSENSYDANKLFSDVYPQFKGIIDIPLNPLKNIQELAIKSDIVFLATSHKVSHDIVPKFLLHNCIVFDLSGAYRIKQKYLYKKYYGFNHQHPLCLKRAVYGLPEWNENKIKNSNLISLPGCYATAVQLGIMPLIKFNQIDVNYLPVVNAISGVSGCGRKSSLNNSFCEISLKPYNIFVHRHVPEIQENLNIPIIFIPHLGKFKRGIIATITCKINNNANLKTIYNSFHNSYKNKPFIRIYKEIPALHTVVGTPFCNISFRLDKNYVIVIVSEDNLLKGASSQAIQCLNIRFGYNQTESLL